MQNVVARRTNNSQFSQSLYNSVCFFLSISFLYKSILRKFQILNHNILRMCFLPMTSPSGRRTHARVKAGTHSVFIEKFPRRYPYGHPLWVEEKKGPNPQYQPGEPVPAHISPITGQPKDGRKPRMAFVVRRPDPYDNAHERGELGGRKVGQVWTPYQTVFGAEFRGGRFFDTGHIIPDERMGAPGGMQAGNG
jgi:hypothetical protein